MTPLDLALSQIGVVAPKPPPRPPQRDRLRALLDEAREGFLEIEGGASPDHHVPQYLHCVSVARATLAKIGGQ
jgi:hypothetical protein